MKQCPLCKLEHPDIRKECNCGYDFELDQIGNRINLRSDLSWSEKILVKERVHNFQENKYGRARSTRDRSGWTKKKTGELFGDKTSNITDDLNLAKNFKKYPELLNCRTKREALKKLKQIKEEPQDLVNGDRNKESVFEQENELRDFIKNNWEKTSLSEEWELKEIEYETHTVGRIDLLAHHKNGKSFLVIELKLSRTGDETVGQLLRYMGWVKINRAINKDVKGLIIAKNMDVNE